MGKTKVAEFPFVAGQREDIDAKILPDGYLTRAKNVRLRKDARFGVRFDYDALGTDTQLSTAIGATDLIPYNDRLLAVGASAASNFAQGDLFELVSQATIDWRGTDADGDARLCPVTALRDMGRPPTQDNSVTRLDCAAAGGLVCLVYQSGADILIHVFRADTDATICFQKVLNANKPRVVAVGTVFWITAVSLAGTEVELYSFDPSADEAIQTETDVTTVGAIVCYDLARDAAGNGFWVAVNKAGPTTTIIPVNSSGVAGTAITGPVVALDHISVCETSTRVHIAVINDTVKDCDLYSYTLAGALDDGPTALFGVSVIDRQPGIQDGSVTASERVRVLVETTDTPVNEIIEDTRIATTHVQVDTYTWPDSSLSAKPRSAVANNRARLFGGIIRDGNGFSSFLGLVQDQMIAAYTAKFGAVKPEADHLPALALDTSTGFFYWPNLVADGDGRAIPLVTEYTFNTSSRRQTAELAGLLFLAGGAPQIFDSRQIVEAGFFEKPAILSATPSVTGPGLVPSGVPLLTAVTWEWRDSQGNFHTSAVSLVTTVTMGASDNTITLVVSTPHSIRGNTTAEQTAGAITVVAWRSISGVNQLRRAYSALATGFGEPLTMVLDCSDDEVRAQGIVYTQAQRGALSGILEHEAPLPAQYIWRFGDRLLTAGGPNPSQAQVTKPLFPGEPANWSGAVGYLVPSIPGRINGVAAIGHRGLLFTREAVYHFFGDGPNDNGEGRYSQPLALESSTGLLDWRSLVETPIGLFFQGSNGHLWLIPVEGGPPIWIGQAVRDTLVAFPTITSATLVVDEQLVTFTCQNAGATDSRIVSFDLRAKTWIVDEFASVTPVGAATHYQGRTVYVTAGTVFQERSTHPPAAFLEHSLMTGTIKPFGSTGWGKLCTIDFVGEYRGDCNLRCRISYDDGKTWTNLKTHELRAAEFAVGDTVRRSWTPLRRKVERFKLDFQALTPSSATEGLVFNAYALELMGETGSSRKASGQRG